MRKRYKLFKKQIARLSKTGFFSIILSTVLVKIVTFTSNILFPRILTKQDFGLLAYADNIRGYFMIFVGMGLVTALLRFGSLTDSRQHRIGMLYYSWKTGIVLNIGLILIYIIVSYMPFHLSGSKSIMLQMSFLPLLLFIYDCICSFFRADEKNTFYSINAFFYAFIYALVQVILAICLGLRGIIIGRYIGLFISVLMGGFLLKRLNVFRTKPIYPDATTKNKMVKYGVGTMLNTGMSILLPMNEMFVLSMYLKDYDAVATYKAASILPSNLPFLVNALLIYIFPVVAKNSNDGVWVWNYYKKIFKYSIFLFIPLVIILIIFTPDILLLFFGPGYESAINLMRVMWIVYTIQATIRGLSGNMISAIGDIKFNNIISAITLILHLVINIILVNSFGIAGSAWGLLIAYTFYGLACIIRLYMNSKR